MRAATGSALAALTLLLPACGDSGRSGEPATIITQETPAPSSAAPGDDPAPARTVDARALPSVAAEGALTITLPVAVDPPSESRWEIVKPGSGIEPGVGDLVEISYEMYSWSSGELVESTEGDLAGPLPIILGDQHVPAVLEHAVLGQPVGSRLLVVFEANLPDLPAYFDADDAYVLAVDVVSVEPDPDRPG